MDNHFNTPAEVIDLSIKACENKTRLPLGKRILLGIMAGAFIPFGGATSSTAAHAVENVGIARALAGCILYWSSIFVTLMANKIGGLQFGIYRNCQISSRVFHTAVAALPLTKANRSDFE